jgi:hypothetical protein
MNAKDLAIMFHVTYESLAPSFGYETRKETKVFDAESANGKLMIAVCEQILYIIDLTAEEKKILRILSDAWNEFLELSEEHSSERLEFMRAIHAAQQIILARPAMRIQKMES